ncbi:DUF4942 domain-containing protein [Klebsiella pneumoniae]|uniref:DUF4942 domain-containing protein n=1 Tax=Klebsiella pneumoniae TaxID=573 RepID=UPI0034D4374B|nr:DUF4942 domain-containing protein [Klebsiella pneumoniae]HBQ8586313.1 DUF4942 domain-containing protein [Klebsiella pneumoniae]HBY1688491.1 DUF4942 domain-containing protein [Klebsiella pneumoniae]
MSTAISIIENTANAVDFRKEMNVIHDIVGECEREIALMNQVHDFVYSGERVSMINRLQVLSRRPNDENLRNVPQLNSVNLDFVKQNIWAEYWRKVTDMTGALLIMPAERRDQWRSQFTLGLQKVTKRDRGGFERQVEEFVGVPEFTADTVIPTMTSLLNDRHKYLAERVYGLFKALSPTHKTNKTYGFSEKLIISCCVTDFWNSSVSLNYHKADVIDDLRVMLHFFAHKEFITLNSCSEMLSAAYRAHNCETGQWMNVDGNLMRVKIFKNGNAHFEIHPDVAWKLNEVLAYSMPAAIPAPCRKAPTTKAPKEFGYIQKTVSTKTRMVIRDRRHNSANETWYFSDSSLQKTEKQDLERTLSFIGGVKVGGSWKFPYEPSTTFDSIVSLGVIPEVKSHQFYPTPASIAQYVAQILKCQPTDQILDPDAGRGDLVAFLDVPEENITSVEISPLFCDILGAKGFNVYNKDFLAWSKEFITAPGYDKIAINPPYSEGRAKEHTLAALNHLNEKGIMAAVLPAGYKPEEWIGSEFVCAKSGREFAGEFEDTGITVAVFVFRRA